MEKRKKQRKIDKMVEAKEKEEKWTHDQRDDFEPCYGNGCHIVGFHFVSAPLKFEKIQAGSEVPWEIIGQLHRAGYDFRRLNPYASNLHNEWEGWMNRETKKHVYTIQKIQWQEQQEPLSRVRIVTEDEW